MVINPNCACHSKIPVELAALIYVELITKQFDSKKFVFTIKGLVLLISSLSSFLLSSFQCYLK